MKSHLKSLFLGSILSLTVLSPLGYAQNNNETGGDENTDVTAARAFWEADIPSGNYMVVLSRISSISIHSYTVNQSFMVHEVNIVTLGQGLVRFYTFDSPSEGALSTVDNLADTGKDLLSHGGERLGTDPNTTVEKEYPTTTHAGTIEYKLATKDDLDQLYKSLKRALREGKGRKFTIR